MLRSLNRLIKGEIALGFFLSTVFWIFVLGWVTSFNPSTQEKEACYQAAAMSGHSTEECKTFWEKTTSDPVAFFTLVLAFSTIGLWCATIGLYVAGRKQFELARQEFIATHRPKIRIRRISRVGTFVPNVPINLHFEGVNIGDSNATIVDIGFDAYIEGTPFNAVPRPPPMPINSIPPGRELHMNGVGRAFSDADVDAIETEASTFRLLGIINYRDDNNVMRSTSFSRKYDPGLRRFVKLPEDDPEADREFEN